MSTTNTTPPTHEYTNGHDRTDNVSIPIDQVAAYTLLNSTHRLHFDDPVVFLNTTILVMLLRLPGNPNQHGQQTEQARSSGRVVLVGLKAGFDPTDRLTTWGPTPLFWIELPASMMSQSTSRSSPLNDQQLGYLALALNRAALREADHGLPLPGGPLVPPTMIALQPGDYDNRPVVNNYVQRMAKIFRVDVDEVWPILAQEMIISEDDSPVGVPLVDARLWDPSYGESLGEYAFLGGSLGRAVYNPVRKVDNVDFMEEDHTIRMMRRFLAHDLLPGCTDDDLRHAMENPSYPLFLSKVPKIGVFALDPGDIEKGVIDLTGQGQRVLLPLERHGALQVKRQASIRCDRSAVVE